MKNSRSTLTSLFALAAAMSAHFVPGVHNLPIAPKPRPNFSSAKAKEIYEWNQRVEAAKREKKARKI